MIIAVDFDGTLCSDRFPEIGIPNFRMIDFLRYTQRENKDKIILWTCRNGKQLEEAVRWCKKVGRLELDAVNENLPEIREKWGGDTRKVYADIYIDDKMKPPVW